MPELLGTHQQAATEALEAKKQALADDLVVLCKFWGDPDSSTLCTHCVNLSPLTKQCRIGIDLAAESWVDGYPICQNFVLKPELKEAYESAKKAREGLTDQ